MPSCPTSVVIRNLLADVGPAGDGPIDDELLARFLRSRDGNALAMLVRRHAAMVWGVCRRLLNHHDAEDAFQAAFLVLVRKAAAVPRDAVAGWLHGVARQTAVRVRATAAKRGLRESQVENMPEPAVRPTRQREEDADVRGAVDEELGRLPGHFRGVVILCDVEGLTRKEAARHLGIPEGSVASRLARARVLLAKRLTRRGIVLSGSSLGTVLSAEAAPAALIAATIEAAIGVATGQAVASSNVAGLTEGVVQAMFATRIKGVLAAVLVAGLAAAGAAGLLHQTQAADQPKGAGAPPVAGKGRSDEKGRPATKGEPARSDRERMVGNWFITNADSGRKGEMWVITEDTILMHAKQTGPVTARYAHRLDPGKDPKQIDIRVTFPIGPPGLLKVIYALEGDDLRLCLGVLDGDRPAAFPEKPKPGEVLVLRRAASGATPPVPTDAQPVLKILTPADAIRLRPEEKVVTVQFKVAAVKDMSATPATGFGPNYIQLKDGGNFSVRIIPPALNALTRLDLEPVKHFTGREVRATGVVKPLVSFDSRGDGPFWIDVTDINPFYVVPR